jgi:hypothetical protein
LLKMVKDFQKEVEIMALKCKFIFSLVSKNNTEINRKRSEKR